MAQGAATYPAEDLGQLARDLAWPARRSRRPVTQSDVAPRAYR